METIGIAPSSEASSLAASTKSAGRRQGAGVVRLGKSLKA